MLWMGTALTLIAGIVALLMVVLARSLRGRNARGAAYV